MKILTHKNILILSVPLLLESTFATALTHQEKLGEKLFSDINLSVQRNQSCESCHSLSPLESPVQTWSGAFEMKKHAASGFVDPENVLHGTSVANGSVARKFGSLNTPSVGYASFSPEFHWDGELFIGGQFWNGRAKDLVEQSKMPFLNPVEMAMPSEWSVIERLKESEEYRWRFRQVYNIKLKKINEGDNRVSKAFDAMAKAIAAFEKTRVFNRFDSKFDFEAAGMTTYTESEQRGADLFDGIAQCNLCHSSDGFSGDNSPALLTDFSYDNLGVPPNPQIPGNPKADLGLLGNPNLALVRGAPSSIAEVEGRQKVMSLRNIELTPPYMHNGVFKTLEEVVHFYNTRDVLPACQNPDDITHPRMGKSCWPKGEFKATQNVEELGDLGLSEQDEADLVAYLKTFTDNYPKWGNSLGKHDSKVPKGTPSPFANFRP